MSGTYNLCVKDTVRTLLEQLNGNPDRVRSEKENYWFSYEIQNKAIAERTEAYLEYLYGTSNVPASINGA